jgi:hypothetical protein
MESNNPQQGIKLTKSLWKPEIEWFQSSFNIGDTARKYGRIIDPNGRHATWVQWDGEYLGIIENGQSLVSLEQSRHDLISN